MPITNNNVKVIDLPEVQILQPLPANTAAGVCIVNDRRGTDEYIYYLSSATSFWRYSVWANTWQQLANPPAGGAFGAGTNMCYDPINGAIWLLLTSGTGAPGWHKYNIATNAWDAAKSVTNLPATFGTDSGIVFPNTAYHASAPSNDYIYVIGNASTVLYRYQISTNAWINTLTVQPSACGAGCDLAYIPAFNTGRLYRLRGATQATIDYYDIGGNSWTGVTYVPATETFAGGSNMKPRAGTTKAIVHKDNTGRLYELDLSDNSLTPLGTQYVVANGAAVVGDKLAYVKETNGIEFLYKAVQTSNQFVRFALVF